MKTWLKDESGSALLMVLLMLIMFSVLGISVLGASISGGFRTEIQEDNIQAIHEAKKGVQQGAALIQSYFEDYDLYEADEQAFQDEVARFDGLEITDDNGNIDYTIEDVTDTVAGIKTASNFTRVFEVESTAVIDGTGGAPARERTFTQKIYLSATPTALQNALGAKEKLNLRGSPRIYGNIYASTLEVNKTGNYVTTYQTNPVKPEFNTNQPAVVTPPSDAEEGSVSVISISDPEHFEKLRTQEDVSDDMEEFLTSQPDQFVLESVPASKYQHIDVSQTYGEKKQTEVDPILYDGGSLDTDYCLPFDNQGYVSSLDLLRNRDQDVLALTSACDASAEHDDDYLIFYDIPSDLSGGLNGLLSKSSNANQWLFIDGDLTIQGAVNSTESLELTQNFLIDGDVEISGNVDFNSVMYVKGETTLYNANISGDKQIALFSEGELSVSRIAEFKGSGDDLPVLNAFLYSERDIELYAVGSYIHIVGGLFSGGVTGEDEECEENGCGDITINAALGDVTKKANPTSEDVLDTNSLENYPRLQIQYDPTIVFEKSSSMPRVDRLQVFYGALEEKKSSSP